MAAAQAHSRQTSVQQPSSGSTPYAFSFNLSDFLNPVMAISLKFSPSHSYLSPASCNVKRNALILVLKDALLAPGMYPSDSLMSVDIISVYNRGPLKNTVLLNGILLYLAYQSRVILIVRDWLYDRRILGYQLYNGRRQRVRKMHNIIEKNKYIF